MICPVMNRINEPRAKCFKVDCALWIGGNTEGSCSFKVLAQKDLPVMDISYLTTAIRNLSEMIRAKF